MEIKSYKKDMTHSYTLGAYPTVEMLKAHPDRALAVFFHSTFVDTAGIKELCAAIGLPVSVSDRTIARLSPKENIYVVGVFDKFDDTLNPVSPHILLDHPSDMGNLGTIIRTAVGFGVRDLAIITPAADVWNPKTVRASMGAVFRLRHKQFSDFDSYRKQYPDRKIYTFMLDGASPLTPDFQQPHEPYTLVFGNEATGLAPDFARLGTGLYIPQTADVDSLNLPVAAAIGMFIFTRGR